VTEGRARRLIQGLWKLTQFGVSFTLLWQQNGSFQTPQSCQFSNRSLFPSLPRVMNLGNDRKNISDILRWKHQRWDFCEASTAWESDVLRLDWDRARYKFGASIFKPVVRYFASKYTHWRKTLRHYWDFSAPGELCPPRYAPGVTLTTKCAAVKFVVSRMLNHFH